MGKEPEPLVSTDLVQHMVWGPDVAVDIVTDVGNPTYKILEAARDYVKGALRLYDKAVEISRTARDRALQHIEGLEKDEKENVERENYAIGDLRERMEVLVERSGSIVEEGGSRRMDSSRIQTYLSSHARNVRRYYDAMMKKTGTKELEAFGPDVEAIARYQEVDVALSTLAKKIEGIKMQLDKAREFKQPEIPDLATPLYNAYLLLYQFGILFPVSHVQTNQHITDLLSTFYPPEGTQGGEEAQDEGGKKPEKTQDDVTRDLLNQAGQALSHIEARRIGRQDEIDNLLRETVALAAYAEDRIGSLNKGLIDSVYSGLDKNGAVGVMPHIVKYLENNTTRKITRKTLAEEGERLWRAIQNEESIAGSLGAEAPAAMYGGAPKGARTAPDSTQPAKEGEKPKEGANASRPKEHDISVS